MAFRRQLYYTLPVALLLLILSEANLATVPTESAYSITNLYENLLQREYPGPVALPDHQLERKAQRSPSLRLRFGRRNDPGMGILPSAEKRWFGDVRQKPIRSPSLRLRFGRRSDPSIPLHSDLDILMNELAKNTDYNDLDIEYDENAYERAARAPRLRWGRSVAANQFDTNFAHDHVERNPLRLPFELNETEKENSARIDEIPFDRNARSPLRLRFGRSAGGGEGNFPIPTIPPWILTAVVGPKLQKTPEASDAASKN